TQRATKNSKGPARRSVTTNCANWPNNIPCRKFRAFRKRHAARRLGINLRPDSRRGEDGARARRKNRRLAFAPRSSVTERTRENLRQIQAGRHGGDERSGPLWLRPARHYFARALLRTKNS